MDRFMIVLIPLWIVAGSQAQAIGDPVLDAMKSDCIKGSHIACVAHTTRYQVNRDRNEFNVRMLHSTALPNRELKAVDYQLTSLSWKKLKTQDEIANKKALEIYRKYSKE